MYHCLETGGGYESLSSFCGIMNMPCISKQAYYNQVNIILEAEAEAELLKAREKLRKLIGDGKLKDISLLFVHDFKRERLTPSFAINNGATYFRLRYYRQI